MLVLFLVNRLLTLILLRICHFYMLLFVWFFNRVITNSFLRRSGQALIKRLQTLLQNSNLLHAAFDSLKLLEHDILNLNLHKKLEN